MRAAQNVFHLAVPCTDLGISARFYESLGCTIARKYPDRITVDFFGDQLVCHLAPDKVESKPQMYPRHFGVTFREKKDFDAVLARARERELRFFQEPMVRFEGLREEHLTFFLIDPSNNLLEFKHYRDPAMMY